MENTQELLNKIIANEKEKSDKIKGFVLNALIVILLLSWIITFFIGYLTGNSIATDEFGKYLSYWKTGYDCTQCNNWNCIEFAKGISYWKNNTGYMNLSQAI